MFYTIDFHAIYICVFLLGICIASFINVVIYRLPLGIDFVKGRSFCPHCHHQLHSIDLIPLLSFLFLKGRCRYCLKSIPIRDSFIELLGGMIALISFHHYGVSWMFLLSLGLAMLFLAISFIDLDTMEIYDGMILICLIFACFISLWIKCLMIERIIGVMIISLPMYLLNLVYKECFGGGDIKLISVCGLMLGWKYLIIGMILAVFFASFYAFYLLIFKKKKNNYIAFAPFICTGVWIALLYGEKIFNFYFHIV